VVCGYFLSHKVEKQKERVCVYLLLVYSKIADVVRWSPLETQPGNREPLIDWGREEGEVSPLRDVGLCLCVEYGRELWVSEHSPGLM
jgi:hypothetical protein